MEQLFELFRRLLNLTDTSYIRYLHDDINWSARMLGIIGPRGVGKTTMLLQHIKLHHSLGPIDRKSTRLNSSHSQQSRMPSSA